MQDVVFAGGRELCEDADAAAGRASVEKLSCLNKEEKKLEKQDVKAVREGLGRDGVCINTRGERADVFINTRGERADVFINTRDEC